MHMSEGTFSHIFWLIFNLCTTATSLQQTVIGLLKGDCYTGPSCLKLKMLLVTGNVSLNFDH